MVNCPVCIVGKLKPSGSHTFCTSCGFIVFVVSQDYIDVSAKVLGVLLSNTKFNDDKALEVQMVMLITSHLPQLRSWLSTIVNGTDELIHALRDAAKAHAVNLQVENTLHNEEKSTDIVCRCGNKEHFHHWKGLLTELCCNECGAEFHAEPGESFKPVYTCKCGSITYELLDAESNVLVCAECALMTSNGVELQ